MASKILKDPTGKIWVDSSNKVIKSVPFSESVIQDGLVFSGAADPNYLTIVDGFVSEAFDIRGNGLKMIQNTVADRPSYVNGALYFYGDNMTIAQASYTMYIVIKLASLATSYTGIGWYNSPFNTLGGVNSTIGLRDNNTTANKRYYQNSTLRTNPVTANLNWHILHTVDSIFSPALRIGNIVNTSVNETMYTYEWGIYNRVLKNNEILYNVNALNAKYQIF